MKALNLQPLVTALSNRDSRGDNDDDEMSPIMKSSLMRKEPDSTRYITSIRILKAHRVWLSAQASNDADLRLKPPMEQLQANIIANLGPESVSQSPFASRMLQLIVSELNKPVSFTPNPA